MGPGIRDFLALLDEVAPMRFAEEWDNPGLQVGGHPGPITTCAMALDPTIAAIKRARKLGAQVLLAHHPLLFKPVSRIDQARYPGSVIHEAIRSSIHVVAAHTNLDAARGGINDILAESLELRDATVLEEVAGSEDHLQAEQGIGQVPLVARLNDGLAVKVRAEGGLAGTGKERRHQAQLRGVPVKSNAAKLLEWPLWGVAVRNSRCSNRGAMSRTTQVVIESMAYLAPLAGAA